MTKSMLKLHQFYSDDNYWLKISRLCGANDRVSFQRIRHDMAVPRRKDFMQKIVEFHSIITGDNREYEQVLMDLLSPVEDSISG